MLKSFCYLEGRLFGNDPVAPYAFLTSALSNSTGKPMSDLDDLIRLLRSIAADTEGIPEDVLAALMQLTTKMVRNIKKDINLEGLLSQPQASLLCMMLDGWAPDRPKTILQVRADLKAAFGEQHCPVQDDKMARALLDQGVKAGLLTKTEARTRNGKQVMYARTNAVHFWASPATLAEKQEKAFQAQMVLPAIEEKSLLLERVELGQQGLKYLCDGVFHPKRCLKELLDVATAQETLSKKRASKSRLRTQYNFATLMTLCVADETLRQPLAARSKKTPMAKAITGYTVELSDIQRVLMYLDDQGRKVFVKQWNNMTEGLAAHIAHAQTLDSPQAEKLPFIISFGYGKL